MNFAYTTFNLYEINYSCNQAFVSKNSGHHGIIISSTCLLITFQLQLVQIARVTPYVTGDNYFFQVSKLFAVLKMAGKQFK
jgi:hypothetical protein